MTRVVTAAIAALSVLGAGLSAAFANEPAENHAPAPALWRVADADTQVFLFGAYHILPPGAQWRSAAMDDAFTRADIVYLEVDSDAPTVGPAVNRVLLMEGFQAPGETLSGILSARDLDRLQAIAGELGLGFAELERMRPWLAAWHLSIQLIGHKGFAAGKGADTVLLNEARFTRKELRFFETMEEQLHLYSRLDAVAEKAFLEQMVGDWAGEKTNFDAALSAWLAGDEKALDEAANAPLRRAAPDVFKRVVLDRNEAWTAQIDRLLDEEKGVVFVSIGARHLVGDGSVRDLLAMRGHKTTRIGGAAGGPDE